MSKKKNKKTIVKSLRLSPEELAWAMEACERAGIEYNNTPTGAVKIMFYAGLNNLLGNEWTLDSPPPHQLEHASHTKQPLDPSTIGAATPANESNRFQRLSLNLSDEQYQRVWQPVKEGHITPLDQLNEGGTISRIIADVLAEHCWELLTKEEADKVREVINACD